MRIRPLLLPVAFVLLAGGGFTWWRSQPPKVATAEVSRGPAVEAVYATGEVEPVVWARIGPAVKGRVAALLVDEGARVLAGQVLGRLDDARERALVEEAIARARFLTEDAARQRSLVDRGVASRQTLERAESEARAGAAIVDAARRRLEDYVLRSPIAGEVLRRDGELGEIVDTNAAVFWVGERRPLRVTADVDEEDIPKVRPGQSVLLKADAFGTDALDGTVDRITPKGDPVQKSYRVRVALPDDTRLMIGMTVEANIVLRREAQALLVPTAALQGPQAERFVLVLEDGMAVRRPVVTGVVGAAQVEIRSGLVEGEAVVLDPPPGLAQGGPAVTGPGPLARLRSRFAGTPAATVAR